MRRIDVDPAVAPPCAHRARSHEARRPWPMRAGWPYIDQQPKLPNGPCSSSRLMVVVSRGIPIPLPRRWKTAETPFIPVSPNLDGLSIPVVLPQWTASAAAWAIAIVVEVARSRNRDARSLAVRLTRAS